MSIAIAKNSAKEFYILSDTKIQFENDYSEGADKYLKEEIKKWGMVKSIIISSDIVLSFAGDNIELVDSLVHKIRLALFKNKRLMYVEIVDIVKQHFELEENISREGEIYNHKCYYILTFYIEQIDKIKSQGIRNELMKLKVMIIRKNLKK